MRHKDVIYLIKNETTYDELGNPVTRKGERMVFANEMSVSMREFYEAGNAGIYPEKQFEIYSFEYEGESELLHNDRLYRVIRTNKQGDKLRIICETNVGR